VSGAPEDRLESDRALLLLGIALGVAVSLPLWLTLWLAMRLFVGVLRGQA
jgi:hypothetical protein